MKSNTTIPFSVEPALFSKIANGDTRVLILRDVVAAQDDILDIREEGPKGLTGRAVQCRVTSSEACTEGILISFEGCTGKTTQTKILDGLCYMRRPDDGHGLSSAQFAAVLASNPPIAEAYVMMVDLLMSALRPYEQRFVRYTLQGGDCEGLALTNRELSVLNGLLPAGQRYDIMGDMAVWTNQPG